MKFDMLRPGGVLLCFLLVGGCACRVGATEQPQAVSSNPTSQPIVEPNVLSEPRRATVADKGSEDGWWNGDVHIVPYGIGWLNVAYDSQRTSPGPFTLFANSHDVEPQDAFHVNARGTRLGLDFTAPDIERWAIAGKVEVDFYGAALTENRAGILLRQAYAELRYDGWRFVGGQTTDVIAPLNPQMVNYGIGYASGNLGFRIPQLRAEHQWQPFEQVRWTNQASLNRTIITDFADSSQQEGHDAGWPTIMARTAIAWLPSDDPQRIWELGISGHVGQEAVDFETPPIEQDRVFNSWSINVDVRLPFTPHFGAQGEFFLGQTLSTFLGGINQGIDPLTRTGIPSLGGWGELWWHFTEQGHWHVGYGTDDPRNEVLSAGRRSRNQMLYANVMWDISPHLNTGIELSHWRTTYIGLAPGDAWRIEVAMKYRF